MRRGISIAMAISGLGMVLTGIWNFFPPFNTEFFWPHVTNSCIFGLLIIIHVCLNWKPLLRYFKRLGWWWILAGVGIAAITWGGIIVPILTVTGTWS